MTYQDLIEHFGSEMSAAAALKFSITTVKNYKSGIPRTSQYAIQVITRGKLKVDNELK